MFPSNSKRRRVSRALSRRERVHGRSRRLRVELMESRLMLSATTPEVELPSLVFNSLTFRDVHLSFAPGQFAPPLVPNDGGFINFGSTGDTRSNFVGSGIQTGVINLGIYDQSTDFDQLFADDATGAFQGTTTLSSSGMQPVKMVFIGPNAEIEQASNALVANPQERTNGASEGGSISIQNLLTSMEQEKTIAVDQQWSLPSANKTTDESHRSLHSTISSKGAISGEWARAAVFEMVSGERITGQLPESTKDKSGSPAEAAASDSDVSLSESKYDNGENGRHVNVVRSDERSSEAESPHREASEIDGRFAAFEIEFSDWNWLGAGPLMNGLTESALIQGQVDDRIASMSLASVAAFDELGQAPAGAIEPTTGENAKLAQRGAIPLLMILALERIATFKSRQSARNSKNEANGQIGKLL